MRKQCCLILSSVIVAGYAIVSQAQCINQYSASDKVEIPIVFEFQDSQHRLDWIYNSLEPKIKLPTKPQRSDPTNMQVQDGKLRITYCIAAEEMPRLNSKFLAYFGPRELSVSSRPISWSNTDFKSPKGDKLRQGRMASVFFLGQPSPDWVIVRRAEWLINAEGFPRIEVEVHNFASNTHPGFELILDFTDSSTRCMSIPVTVTVPLALSFSKGNIKLASGDPQFSELINREAKFEIGPCGELDFEARIGKTGPLQGNAVLTIRYTFNQKTPPRIRKIPRDRNYKPVITDIYALEYRSIYINGERAFPTSMKIQNSRTNAY